MKYVFSGIRSEIELKFPGDEEIKYIGVV